MPPASEVIFFGIDVQSARGCPFAVLDAAGRWLDSGWANGESHSEVAEQLVKAAERHAGGNRERIKIGVDSPRMCLPAPRDWYWEGARRQWRRRRGGDIGRGRHCEVILLAHRIATPQWTSTEHESPEWMRRGFTIYHSLQKFSAVYEVFPSASYQMLENDSNLTITINFRGFAAGVKDMLDAVTAAATVREYVQGRGQSIGGGDGLGEIILPRPIGSATISEVMSWPD
jgi:hypothetical protein